MVTKPKTLIFLSSALLVSSAFLPSASFAEEPPPSIPRPEGIGVIGMVDGNPIYGPIAPTPSIPRPEGIGVIGMIDGNPIYGPINGIVSWYPGMKDSSGNIIPPPLYNQDGTPYVEGVSPRPIIPSLSESLKNQSVEWFPGMRDPRGNEIPTPIFNLDGSLYVEGVSPRPRIPVYIDSKFLSQLSNPEKITDKILAAKINAEIKSMDVELSKSKSVYVLNFGGDISAIDSELYLSAINKKTKKISKIPVKIDSNGQAVAPTKIDLSKYNVYLKRGKTTLKKVSISN